MTEHIKEIKDSDFENEVLNSNTPVLVDFWAEWCGPCKMVAPTLEVVASELIGKVKIVKVNVDENPESPAKYNVRGIPTLILFNDGNVEGTKVGVVNKTQLQDFITQHVSI